MISPAAGLQERPGYRAEKYRGPLLSRSGARLAAVLLILSFVATVPILSGAEPDGRYAILLAGASGNPDYQEMYLQEIQKLYSVLTGPLGFPRDQVTVLFDDPEKDPGLIGYPSTRKGLEEACLDLSQRVKNSDLLFVFIDGHGSFDGKTYKLNLVGNPDPTAWELAETLYSIPAGRFVVVNATNCSGGSLQALSGDGKVVITATKSGQEGNQAHMGGFFVESLENNAADANKDDRVSLLEAFSYTKLKVEDYYKNEGNIKTEHAVLDDNGDGQGQSDPSPENKEGLLARTTFLDRGVRPEVLAAGTAEQQKLALQVRELEKQIEALKYKKDELPQADYEKQLEELLLELARTNAKLRE